MSRKEVQVPLTPGRDTGDDKVIVFLDARPAVEVLSLLAQHFNFRWFRIARGYELRQDGTEKRHEAARGEAELEAEWAELRTWAARLERLVVLPRSKLQQRADEIGTLLEDGRLAPEERSRLAAEAQAIRDALRPETGPASAILRSLTPAQVQQLRRDGTLLLSAEDGSLSPRLLPSLRNADPGKDVAFFDAQERPVWADAQINVVQGRYEGGPPRPGDRRTELIVRYILRREVEGKQQWSGVIWSPLLPARPRSVAAAAETDDPTLLRPVELGSLHIRRRGVSPATGDRATAASGGLWPDWPTLGDVAQALHRALGLEALADSFARSRLDPKWVSGRRPVVSILNALAAELDYTWRKEGNLLLLRSRSYYRDREQEVPARVLHPWQKRAARAGVSPLDALAELAAALDDHQTLGMSLYWGWYLKQPWVAAPAGTPYFFHHWRRHLRFWAGLNPPQRQEVLSGGILPVERMSPAQRAAFVTALTDPAASLEDSEAAFLLSRRRLTPAELLSGGFSVKKEEWRVQRFLGEKPGKEREIVVKYPANRPPILSKLPQEFRWSPVGEPDTLHDFAFSYHLAAVQKPSRIVDLDVVRPQS